MKHIGEDERPEDWSSGGAAGIMAVGQWWKDALTDMRDDVHSDEVNQRVHECLKNGMLVCVARFWCRSACYVRHRKRCEARGARESKGEQRTGESKVEQGRARESKRSDGD